MDYHNTSYGAQGGADGGGFVGGDTQGSQSGRKGDYGKDTVRPVTIKQILEAEAISDSEFKIDGDTIAHVTFVGQVRGLNTVATHIQYRMDDGTGIIEVKEWLDGGNEDRMDTDSKIRPQEDQYCRVHGKLKAFNDKAYVYAHVIRPITDYNEVNYHLLEATAVHLFFTKGPPSSIQANGNAESNGMNGANDAGANGRGGPAVSAPARRVLNQLKNFPQNNEGLHVHQLASELGMGVNDVYKATEELERNGLIFTTVDDNTWAPLDS